MRRTRHTAAPSLRGFTAIEITAVAAIIAILTLIMVPIVRNRVAEAKVTAAQDDMHTIEKAQGMAFGFTGQYFRLFDMIRPESNQDPTLTPAEVDREWRKLPPATWNRPVPLGSGPFLNLVENWKGPFMSVQRSLTVQEVINNFPYLVRTVDSSGSVVGNGPILIATFAGQSEGLLYEWLSNSANALTRLPYPVDPWGNPYLFYGSGEINAPATVESQLPNQTTVRYSSALVVSLGPDGVPGNPDLNVAGYEFQPATYYRESGILGQTGSDDMLREF